VTYALRHLVITNADRGVKGQSRGCTGGGANDGGMMRGDLSSKAKEPYAPHLTIEPRPGFRRRLPSTTAYLRDRGNVPNMFRTMAHRPEIFETIIAHMEAVLNTGTLSKALKELVHRADVAAEPHAYCLASHTAIAAAGLDGRADRSAPRILLAASEFTERRRWRSIWRR
jgi:alkylhydroperoxidase/carboxymuconolactone decarboxylase family protein YurZ